MYTNEVVQLHSHIASHMPIEAFVETLNPAKFDYESKAQFYNPVRFTLQVTHAPVNGAIRVDVPVHANPNWLRDMKRRVGSMLGIDKQFAEKIEFRTVTRKPLDKIAVEDLPHVGKINAWVDGDQLVRMKEMPKIPAEYSVTKEENLHTFFDSMAEDLPDKLATSLVNLKRDELNKALVPGGAVQKIVEQHIQATVKDWPEFVRVHHINSPYHLSKEGAAQVCADVASEVRNTLRDFIKASDKEVSDYLAARAAEDLRREYEGKSEDYAPVIGSSMEATLSKANGLDMYTKICTDAIAYPFLRKGIVKTMHVKPIKGCRWSDDHDEAPSKKPEGRGGGGSGGGTSGRGGGRGGFGGGTSGWYPGKDDTGSLGLVSGVGWNIKKAQQRKVFEDQSGARFEYLSPENAQSIVREWANSGTPENTYLRAVTDSILNVLNRASLDRIAETRPERLNSLVKEIQSKIDAVRTDLRINADPLILTDLLRRFDTAVAAYYGIGYNSVYAQVGWRVLSLAFDNAVVGVNTSGIIFTSSLLGYNDKKEVKGGFDSKDLYATAEEAYRAVVASFYVFRDAEQFWNVIKEIEFLLRDWNKMSEQARNERYANELLPLLQNSPRNWNQQLHAYYGVKKQSDNPVKLADRLVALVESNALIFHKFQDEDFSDVEGRIFHIGCHAETPEQKKAREERERYDEDAPPKDTGYIVDRGRTMYALHPVNAHIHHTIHPVAGKLPVYYEMNHLEKDMTSTAAYDADVDATFSAYHLFSGVAQMPEDTGSSFVRSPLFKPLESHHTEDKKTKKKRTVWKYDESREPIESKAPPVIPIQSKAPPVIPIDRPVSASIQSKAPPVIPIERPVSASIQSKARVSKPLPKDDSYGLPTAGNASIDDVWKDYEY